MSSRTALEFLNGDHQGTVLQIQGNSLTIGRSDQCDVVLENVRGVSRQHAEIVIKGDKTVIRDLDSQNGVYVNDKKIKSAALAPGAVIRIGESEIQVVDLDANAPVNAKSSTPKRSSNRNAAKRARAEAVAVPDNDYAMEATEDDGEDPGGGQFLFLFLLIMCLGAGGLYLFGVISNATDKVKTPQFILVKGEERLIPSARAFAGFELKASEETGGDIITVSEYDGWLKDELARVNKENATRGLPTLYFLKVAAKARGDCVLHFTNGSGKTVSHAEIMVRGNRVGYEDLDSVQAADLMRRMIQDGKRLEDDGQDFLAMRLYRRAEQIGLRAPEEEHLYFTAQDSYRRMRLKLRKVLSKRFSDAMLDAFPPTNSPTRGHLRAAYELLDESLHMIADSENLEYQVFAYWKAELHKLIESSR